MQKKLFEFDLDKRWDYDRTKGEKAYITMTVTDECILMLIRTKLWQKYY